MTPAIEIVSDAHIEYRVHEYEIGSKTDSWGAHAALALGVPPERVFKTLIAKLDDGSLAVGIVPVSSQLNLKTLAKVAGAKRAGMAGPGEVRRATGYVPGAVSPLGQKKRLQTIIDESAAAWPSIFVSAGRRGLELEMSPADLTRLANARSAGISR